MGYNAEFLLPVSVRAITVGSGLDASKQMRYGIPFVIVRALLAIILGYIFLKFWPSSDTCHTCKILKSETMHHVVLNEQ